MTTKKITDKKIITLLFWVSWTAYFSTYLGRLNFNAVIVELVQTGFMTKTRAGLVSTCYFFAYGAGQSVSGILADRFNARRLMLTGLVLSAALNFAMGSIPEGFMPVLWGMNGLALSLTWAPIMRIFAEKLRANDRHILSVHFGTCSVAGALGAYLMCSAIVHFLSWEWVFRAAAVILLASAVFWYFGMGKVFSFAEKYGITETEEVKKFSKNESIRNLVLVSGLLFAIPAVLAQGALKDGVTAWVPTFLYEQYHIGSTLSMLLTALLPIVNLLGVYLGDYVNKRLFRNELSTSALFFAISALGVVGLTLAGNVWLSLSCLIVTTTGMCAINLLIVGLMPLKFAAHGRAATMTGILNALVYLGSALSTYGISAVTQSAGWGMTIFMWLGIAVVGLLFCLWGVNRWTAFKK